MKLYLLNDDERFYQTSREHEEVSSLTLNELLDKKGIKRTELSDHLSKHYNLLKIYYMFKRLPKSKIHKNPLLHELFKFESKNNAKIWNFMEFRLEHGNW